MTKHILEVVIKIVFFCIVEIWKTTTLLLFAFYQGVQRKRDDMARNLDESRKMFAAVSISTHKAKFWYQITFYIVDLV